MCVCVHARAGVRLFGRLNNYMRECMCAEEAGAGGWGRECKTVRSKDRDHFYVFMYLSIFAARSGEKMAGLFVLEKEMRLDLDKSETVASTLPLLPLCVSVCVCVCVCVYTVEDKMELRG